MGYSAAELAAVPDGANLGLGCGNPQPTQMLPIYDCGEGLHPSDLGYNKMGDAIDLSLFE